MPGTIKGDVVLMSGTISDCMIVGSVTLAGTDCRIEQVAVRPITTAAPDAGQGILASA